MACPADETDLNLAGVALPRDRQRGLRPRARAQAPSGHGGRRDRPEPPSAVDEFERAELSRRVETDAARAAQAPAGRSGAARRARSQRGRDGVGARASPRARPTCCFRGRAPASGECSWPAPARPRGRCDRRRRRPLAAGVGGGEPAAGRAVLDHAQDAARTAAAPSISGARRAARARASSAAGGAAGQAQPGRHAGGRAGRRHRRRRRARRRRRLRRAAATGASRPRPPPGARPAPRREPPAGPASSPRLGSAAGVKIAHPGRGRDRGGRHHRGGRAARGPRPGRLGPARSCAGSRRRSRHAGAQRRRPRLRPFVPTTERADGATPAGDGHGPAGRRRPRRDAHGSASPAPDRRAWVRRGASAAPARAGPGGLRAAALRRRDSQRRWRGPGTAPARYRLGSGGGSSGGRVRSGRRTPARRRRWRLVRRTARPEGRSAAAATGRAHAQRRAHEAGRDRHVAERIAVDVQREERRRAARRPAGGLAGSQLQFRGT